MGQRSHIYIRIRDGRSFDIANYYQWNYGERMVSRAAHGLTWLKEHPYYFEEQLENIWDVNFDMKDYQRHSDLIKECEGLNEPLQNFGELGDPGDGELCIEQVNGEIRYCFMHHGKGPLSAEEYMLSDIGRGSEEELETYIKTHKIKTAYEKNLRALRRFKLMTEEELSDFLNAPIGP